MDKQQFEKTAFKWTVYGISVGTLLMVMVATFAIVRIVDGKWLSWQLPAILGIVFIVVVSVSAMFTSLGDVRTEINKEFAKVEAKAAAKAEKKAAKSSNNAN